MNQFARMFIISAVFIFGCGSFARAADGAFPSDDDRQFFVGQLVDELKTGSNLTDPGARIAAAAASADYYEKIGDFDNADSQIKTAAFQLLNASHIDFVGAQDEAVQLMRQVELLAKHNDSQDVQDYITQWKREVAARALNENQVVDPKSMGNFSSLVSTLASSNQFDDLFDAALKKTVHSRNITVDQAVALDAYIQAKKIQDFKAPLKNSKFQAGCDGQTAGSQPSLDPGLLKDYAAAAMKLIDPKQDNMNAIMPLVWSLRSMIGPADQEEFEKRAEAFWAASVAKYQGDAKPFSWEAQEKLAEAEQERFKQDSQMVGAFTRQMTACMARTPKEDQGGCWAVFADSVALLSDPGEQMIHSAGALVMRDDPQDREKGATVLAVAIDTENKNRKINAAKIGIDYYLNGLTADEGAFAEPIGMLARHDPRLALQLANQLDDEKARVAAKESILMHVTETADEGEKMKALEGASYSNDQNEMMEQMEESLSQDSGDQSAPSSQYPSL
jgi:hypothetical protein